jgi:hypothetical protein
MIRIVSTRYRLGMPPANGELKPGELPLLVLLTVLVSVAMVWFRSPGRWVDVFLLLAVAGTLALVALVLLG